MSYYWDTDVLKDLINDKMDDGQTLYASIEDAERMMGNSADKFEGEVLNGQTPDSNDMLGERAVQYNIRLGNRHIYCKCERCAMSKIAEESVQILSVIKRLDGEVQGVFAGAKASITAADSADTKTESSTVKENDAKAGSEDNTEVLNKTSTSEGVQPKFTSLMNNFSATKTGGANDYTKHKTYESHTTSDGSSRFSAGSKQRAIQDVAQTDAESGIRYVTVDGLKDANGNDAKVYCVAAGTALAAAATGTARCGDVFKVTWDDGTWDYVVIGDVKNPNDAGGSSLGHNNGYANALELIIDRNATSNSARNLREQGTIGTWGPNYSGNYGSTDTTKHWSQAFSNVELTDIYFET